MFQKIFLKFLIKILIIIIKTYKEVKVFKPLNASAAIFEISLLLRSLKKKKKKLDVGI